MKNTEKCSVVKLGSNHIYESELDEFTSDNFDPELNESTSDSFESELVTPTNVIEKWINFAEKSIKSGNDFVTLILALGAFAIPLAWIVHSWIAYILAAGAIFVVIIGALTAAFVAIIDASHGHKS